MSKEVERTEKWMKMMGVKRKDGGNAVEWVWKGEGVTKVCHGLLLLNYGGNLGSRLEVLIKE